MSGRKGVSTIIGGIIILAIVFTTLAPLISYYEQINQQFELSVLKRWSFEEAKRNEVLLASAYQDFGDGGKIKVWVKNGGAVTLKVKRVWIIDRADPSNPTIFNLTLTLTPHSPPAVIDPNLSPIVGRVYDVRVLTERGNVIVPSGSPIYAQASGPLVVPTNFTHALTVTLLNMTAGRMYVVRLSGNMPGGEVTYTHRATLYNETVSLAFGVSPGEYVLEISDDVSYSQTLSISVPEVRHVTIPIPKATSSVSVNVLAYAPPIVTCSSGVCKPPTQEFLIQAMAINTGNVRLCNLQFTLRIIHVGGPGTHFSSTTPSVVVPPQICVEPGSAAGPVSWSIRPSSRERHVDSVEVIFRGYDPLGDPFTATFSQRIATVRGQ